MDARAPSWGWIHCCNQNICRFLNHTDMTLSKGLCGYSGFIFHSYLFLTDSNPMRPATMANKHISSKPCCRAMENRHFTHWTPVFPPWPILQIKVKCLNNSVSQFFPLRHTGASVLVTNPIEIKNTNFQETVTVNELYFEVKRDAKNPKIANRASFFIHQELIGVSVCSGLRRTTSLLTHHRCPGV